MKGTVYGNKLPRGTQMKKRLGTDDLGQRLKLWSSGSALVVLLD